MKFYKFALWKAYFDKGYGVTSYVKYVVGFVSLKAFTAEIIALIFFIYGISCFIIGKIWYKLRITDAENEVNNVFNPFAVQVRKKLDVPNP